MSFMPTGDSDAPAVTDDAFLGGRLRVLQPATGFRSGLDAVMLAASIPAGPGERALECGMGAGVAGLCLARRVAGVEVHGLEGDGDLVALARQNAARNGLADAVIAHHGRIEAVPEALRALAPDHVFANPPYFETGTALPARDAGRRAGRLGPAGQTARWVQAMVGLARRGGSVTLVHRTESLPALLDALEGRLGALRLFPLWPRAGAPAKRIILSGRPGSRAPLRLLAGLVLHDAAGGYTPAAEAVLREGTALPLG